MAKFANCICPVCSFIGVVNKKDFSTNRAEEGANASTICFNCKSHYIVLNAHEHYQLIFNEKCKEGHELALGAKAHMDKIVPAIEKAKKELESERPDLYVGFLGFALLFDANKVVHGYSTFSDMPLVAFEGMRLLTNKTIEKLSEDFEKELNAFNEYERRFGGK